MKMLTRWWSYPDRWAYLWFTLYLAVYPGTLVTVMLEQVPANGAVFGGVLLGLQGMSVASLLWGRLQRTSLPIMATILVGALVVEYVGATYDIPFGSYDYTSQLGWRIADTVPVVILLAWLFSTIGTWMCAYLLIPHSHPLLRSALAGVFIVLFDLQIEPVATIVNQYWVWVDSGWYYGVPWVNFVGWWLTGTVLAFLNDTRLQTLFTPPFTPTQLPLWHLILCMGLFVAMNSLAGHWLAFGISLGSVIALWLFVFPRMPLRDTHRL